MITLPSCLEIITWYLSPSHSRKSKASEESETSRRHFYSWLADCNGLDSLIIGESHQRIPGSQRWTKQMAFLPSCKSPNKYCILVLKIYELSETRLEIPNSQSTLVTVRDLGLFFQDLFNNYLIWCSKQWCDKNYVKKK